MANPIFSQTLKNGAQVIQHDGTMTIVLCIFRDELVTWNIDQDGNAYWGHYFKDDIESAVADFKARTAR